jgi:hypothetical protein
VRTGSRVRGAARRSHVKDISRFGLSDLVVQAGQPLDDGVMTLPVQKDDTVLLGILDKGMASISDAEIQAIRDRWMSR